MAPSPSLHFAGCPCCNPTLHTTAQYLLQPLLSRRLFLLGTGSFAATLALSTGPTTPPAQSQVTPSLDNSRRINRSQKKEPETL